MKKRFKIIMAVCVFLSVLSFTTCETLMKSLQEPLISLHSVELANISINGVQLLCKVQVDNPNPFTIPFPETSWQLFINNNSFTSGVVRNNESLRARQKTLVDVLVNLDYLGVFNSFASLKGSQKAGYKVALGVKFTLPLLGDKVWNFEHEGEVPLPQLPKLSAPVMSIGSRDFTRAEIIVTMNIENPNVFPLQPITINYDYQINRNSFLRGDTKSEIIPPSSTSPMVFRLTVTYADLLRSFASLVTSSSVSSSISITGNFGIPAFGNEPFSLNASGTLPLR